MRHPIISILFIGFFLFATPVLAADRRASGPGSSVSFGYAEPVVGSVIAVQDGKTYYDCYAPGGFLTGGTVTSGVVNYWPGEIQGVSQCSDSAGGPRKATGAGGSASFAVHDKVAGTTIRFSDGTQYNNCYIENVNDSGTVISGVVNYWPGEIQGIPQCSWESRGVRRPTGEGGSLTFGYADRVLGAYIRLDTGKELFNCYAPGGFTSGGTVYSGVIDYMPGEANGLSSCY